MYGADGAVHGTIRTVHTTHLMVQRTDDAANRQHRRYVIPQAVKRQSSAPEDGRNYRPKHVELIVIINKILLLLHLLGCLYH